MAKSGRVTTGLRLPLTAGLLVAIAWLAVANAVQLTAVLRAR